MNITNPFSKLDPFHIDQSIHRNTSINQSIKVISSIDLNSQSDIELKFLKLIKNKNKDFLLNIKYLLEKELLRFQVNT